MRIMVRPRKFDEPVIRKTFDLPESLVERLGQESERRKQTAIEIVRQALAREFDGTSTKTALRAVPATKKSDIKIALLEALEEHQPRGAMTVELSPELNKKLETVSESIGYSEPGQFIEEVLRVMLREPAQLRELVLGKALLDLEKALGVVPEVAEPVKKKLRKSA